MKKSVLSIAFVCIVSIILKNSVLIAQEPVSWLSDFTGEITAGSYTYRYSFSTLDNNNCKLRIEEKKADKKGATSTKAFIVYLADINPASLNFKTSGTSVLVNMEIKQSQKFISVFDEGELEGFASSISINMSEVDMARSFIEVMKANCEKCKVNDRTWTSREETIAWLSQNIGESVASGTIYIQKFVAGEKQYLAKLETESTDSKGTKQTVLYNFNLNDIDPAKIKLVVSDKYFKIELPVRNNAYYIQLKKSEEFSYAKDLEIYADDIEKARNTVNAFEFLVSNTPPPVRKAWTGYLSALTFVKETIGEVRVGTVNIAQEFGYDESPSGMVHFITSKTDSKGVTSRITSSFYMNDMQPAVSLSVSSKNISLDLLIRDKNKYIKQTGENSILPYASSIEIYVTDLEKARDLLHALEYAISNSASTAIEFTSVEKAINWMTENTDEVKIDAQTTKQSLKVIPENENKIELEVVTTVEGSTPVNELFEIYPEDLSLEDLVIKVSGKKLSVPLTTGKFKYIKVHKDTKLQSFTSDSEVLFDDVQQARNFIAAASFLKGKNQVIDRSVKDKAVALAYISEHIIKVEVEGIVYEQKTEKRDNDDCKLSYTMIQTDSKGVSVENVYEFTLSDIDTEDSEIYVSGKELQVKLETKDNVKLIKPYKNGVAGNFVYSVNLKVEDVLVAKKILGAFTSLAKQCN